MKKNNKVFQRIEQKYFLSENDFKEIILKCGDYIEKEPYYFSTISSIYFDSPIMILL